MLTPRQKQCLDNIAAVIRNEGHAPSLDDLAGLLCLKSRGGVSRLLRALRERGFVTWTPRRARSLALTSKALLLDVATLPTVRLSPAKAKEIDAIVATRNFGSREAVVDWLLECALWSWTHGSLPPIGEANRAPFEKEAAA